MTNKEAYEKINHTLCLNSMNLNFAIDDVEHLDCINPEEMIECLEIIEKDSEILRILHDKEVSLECVKRSNNYKEYIMGLQIIYSDVYLIVYGNANIGITEQEYNLLKEWLEKWQEDNNNG